jgi:hypothetical protein
MRRIDSTCIHLSPLLFLKTTLLTTLSETTSDAWGPPVFANRRASIEPRITAQNEDMFRTFHPALRSEPEVFTLTRKATNHPVWLVFPRKGDSGPFTHVGGRAVHTQPYFETPTEHGMKYAMTREDPIPRAIDVNETLSGEDLGMVKGVFPRAIGIQVFQCECVVVWFGGREDMVASWKEGTPVSIGGLMVGYRC